MTYLAEGMSLKDGSAVLAKIAFAHSNASMCIEREAHMSVPYHAYATAADTPRSWQTRTDGQEH